MNNVKKDIEKTFIAIDGFFIGYEMCKVVQEVKKVGKKVSEVFKSPEKDSKKDTVIDADWSDVNNG